MSDPVNHPKHYNDHPSGVECITVVEHMSFNLGNAIKYIWRAGLKNADAETDLRKALWCIERELGRIGSKKA
jgi:hypothetical protein